MTITELPTEKLTPYAQNPRFIYDEAVDAVAKSISQYGFQQPIVVDKDYVVIAGHTRLRAAIKLGLETVPCVVAANLSDAQARAYRLADNKTADFSEWDAKTLLEELAAMDAENSDWFSGFEESPVYEYKRPSKKIVSEDALDAAVSASPVYYLTLRSQNKAKIDAMEKYWQTIADPDEDVISSGEKE